MPMQPSPKVPIKFNQLDTEDLAIEVERLRRLKFPLNFTERVQAANELRSYAIEWGIGYPKKLIDYVYDYEESVALFEETKGMILKIMRKELRKLSDRDSESLRRAFSGGFGGFFEEER